MPPLTVAVAAVAEWLAASAMTTEIESPLLPVPVTVTLLALAMLTFGVLVKVSVGATVIFVSVWVTVVLLPTALVSVTV